MLFGILLMIVLYVIFVCVYQEVMA